MGKVSLISLPLCMPDSRLQPGSTPGCLPHPQSCSIRGLPSWNITLSLHVLSEWTKKINSSPLPLPYDDQFLAKLQSISNCYLIIEDYTILPSWRFRRASKQCWCHRVAPHLLICADFSWFKHDPCSLQWLICCIDCSIWYSNFKKGEQYFAVTL